MKKYLPVITAVLILAMDCFAGDAASDKVKQINDRITKITNDYYSEMRKVKSPKELVKVINKYAAEMKKLEPEIKAVKTEHGDDYYWQINNFWFELYNKSDFYDERIQSYYEDPLVQEADDNLLTVLGEIGFAGY